MTDWQPIETWPGTKVLASDGRSVWIAWQGKKWTGPTYELDGIWRELGQTVAKARKPQFWMHLPDPPA
jgi:hypothetical protein